MKQKEKVMIFIDALRSDGSIIVNKALARTLGIETAIMYSELLSKYNYFLTRGMLGNEEWFFNTIENMEEDTCISAYSQRKAIKKLKEMGLIEYSIRGIPAKRYFKIVLDDALIGSLISHGKLLKKEHLDIKNSDGNNTAFKNTKVNNTNLGTTDPLRNMDLRSVEQIAEDFDIENIDAYVRLYFKITGKEHPPILNSEEIDNALHNENSFYESYTLRQAMVKYLREDKSDGNIQHFMYAYPRYVREVEDFGYEA